jgi:tetratricopeptide (TPR) repeat protein
MTMTLAHPAAEDLGRFVDGTLDDAGRAAVVTHIADCDECRTVVVDAAEFVEPAVEHSDRRWWVASAAAITMLLGGTFIWNVQRDPLTPVFQASARQAKRLVEARLSGFQHRDWSPTRGGDQEQDPADWELEGKIAEVLERKGDDPKTLHARGVVLLLEATIEKSSNPSETIHERDSAVKALLAAATRAPNNAIYQSDLAAAMIATGQQDPPKLESAVRICDKALRIDSGSREALFNRALALDSLARKTTDKNQGRKAIAAYDRYLAVDSSSPWSNEARNNRERVRSSLQP